MRETKTKTTSDPKWTAVERIALKQATPDAPKVFELPAETRRLWEAIERA